MTEKKIIAITLDPDAIGDDSHEICSFDIEGNLTKLEDKETPKSGPKLLSRFLNTDLPYIKYQEVNPFDIFDEQVKTTKTRIYRVSDAMLERDSDISNSMGMKTKKKEDIEFIKEHFYLPGLPKLISDEYPLFKPDVEQSYEYSNKEFYKKFVKKFEAVIYENNKNKLKKVDTELMTKLQDLLLFQLPVDYENYFSCDPNEFHHVFMDTIFEWITEIYSEYIYTEKDLKKFFKTTDKSYHPVITSEPFQSLKPIGSVGHTSYPFAISDQDTALLNQLLVHVEIVNLSLGIGEGYELYFNPKKRNFKDERIMGAESTKINNFIKRFSRAVSICLNSKINRFVLMDYYWVGVFEIEDVFDGEVEDAKRLISKVKVRHFAYYNFEDDKNLTIRKIIASFYYLKPQDYLKTQDQITSLSNKIIKEWTIFKKNENNLLLQSPTKRLKKSPFVYRTSDGITFSRQLVDLDKSLVEFIAIGMKWSCQTIVVDIKKLFIDKKHLQLLKYKKSKVLLSVYDEYYQFQDLSLNDRHIGLSSSKFANPEILQNASAVFKKWESSMKSYLKAKELQGDVLVKVIDYGYLEDRAYNGKEVHFKTDGYYILFDPVADNYELEAIDHTNDQHYQLCKEALIKLHKAGVTFHPLTEPIAEIFKIYNGKVYIINLEDTSTIPTSSHIRRDLSSVDKIFKKKSESGFSSSKRRRSSANTSNIGLSRSQLASLLSQQLQQDNTRGLFDGYESLSDEEYEVY